MTPREQAANIVRKNTGADPERANWVEFTDDIETALASERAKVERLEDAALFAAAVWSGRADVPSQGIIRVRSRLGDGTCKFTCTEYDLGPTDYNTTPLGTPDLTPEAREALRRAIGEKA